MDKSHTELLGQWQRHREFRLCYSTIAQSCASLRSFSLVAAQATPLSFKRLESKKTSMRLFSHGIWLLSATSIVTGITGFALGGDEPGLRADVHLDWTDLLPAEEQTIELDAPALVPVHGRVGLFAVLETERGLTVIRQVSPIGEIWLSHPSKAQLRIIFPEPIRGIAAWLRTAEADLDVVHIEAYNSAGGLVAATTDSVSRTPTYVGLMRWSAEISSVVLTGRLDSPLCMSNAVLVTRRAPYDGVEHPATTPIPDLFMRGD